MKKLLLYGFVLILCLAVSCKKDAQNKKVYLLQQQIIDYSSANNPVDTINYAYDDQNHIIKISEATGQSRGSFNVSYDAEGRVSVGRKVNNAGTVVSQYTFHYTADSILYYFTGIGEVPDTGVMTFNSKKQLIRIQTRHDGYRLFTYDAKGNIYTSVAYKQDGTNNLLDNNNYIYDDQKNPFSDMPPNNYFFMYIAGIDVSTLINNIKIKNGDTHSYTYNSDGFPVKGNIDIGSNVFPVSYNYILK